MIDLYRFIYFYIGLYYRYTDYIDLYRFIGVSRHLQAFPDTCRRFQTLVCVSRHLNGPRPMGRAHGPGPDPGPDVSCGNLNKNTYCPAGPRICPAGPWNLPAGTRNLPAGARNLPAEVVSGTAAQTPVPHAPGARMTVVTLTPSNENHMQGHVQIIRRRSSVKTYESNTHIM